MLKNVHMYIECDCVEYYSSSSDLYFIYIIWHTDSIKFYSWSPKISSYSACLVVPLQGSNNPGGHSVMLHLACCGSNSSSSSSWCCRFLLETWIMLKFNYTWFQHNSKWWICCMLRSGKRTTQWTTQPARQPHSISANTNTSSSNCSSCSGGKSSLPLIPSYSLIS